MPFSPENFSTVPDQETVVTPEKSESIDDEIAQEAAKLETTVAELMEEINSQGGMEKFNEKLKSQEYSENFGKGLIDEQNVKVAQSNFKRNVNAIGAAVFAVAGVWVTGALKHDPATMGNQEANMLPFAIGMFSSCAVALKAIAAQTKLKLEQRKAEREKLKMKMADAQIA